MSQANSRYICLFLTNYYFPFPLAMPLRHHSCYCLSVTLHYAFVTNFLQPSLLIFPYVLTPSVFYLEKKAYQNYMLISAVIKKNFLVKYTRPCVCYTRCITDMRHEVLMAVNVNVTVLLGCDAIWQVCTNISVETAATIFRVVSYVAASCVILLRSKRLCGVTLQKTVFLMFAQHSLVLRSVHSVQYKTFRVTGCNLLL